MTAHPADKQPEMSAPEAAPVPESVSESVPCGAAPAQPPAAVRPSPGRRVLEVFVGSRPTWLGALLGVALLGASVPLGLRYAKVPVEPGHCALPALGRTLVASDALRDWMHMKPSRLRALLDASDHNGWETLVLRTVLLRWRMRPVAPGLFDSLMHRWSHGWWSVPDAAKWTEILSAVDARWVKARGAAIAQGASPGGVPKPPVLDLPDGTGILFPYRMRTAQVGSRVAILMDVPVTAIPKAPRIAWCANIYGVIPYRLAVGTVRPLPGAPAGQQRIAVTVDLSAEPLWLNPRTIAHSLVLLDGSYGGKVLELRFEDSPFLPVPGKNRPKPGG